MTIAIAIESEQELLRLEARHICPEMALAELRAQEKIAAAKFKLA
jgi:hypothetical protein